MIMAKAYGEKNGRDGRAFWKRYSGDEVNDMYE
jgi:hypothetical protein